MTLDVQVLVHNLPTQPTPFVGRSRELVDIFHLLNDSACRLLTLVGPGGIGKTRLASEIAATALDRYPDGAYFVALQPLMQPDQIVPAMVEALQYQCFTSGDPKSQLIDYLREKKLLLVMDNYEHLLDGASLVSEILMEAPGVNVLATSRERLNIRDEWVFEVSGLNVPGKDVHEGVEGYSAVQLFAQQARRVSATFSLDDELAAVVRICTLLDGMPLALELAATWVRVLPCGEIVKEIERGLDILETSTRDVPVRHRNIRAVLDSSWDRLSRPEQNVLERMSVFRGGIEREAAQTVACASLPILASLVDQSWLKYNVVTCRYDVHELLRQYAREQLDCTDFVDAALDAHMEYFADMMYEGEKGIQYRRQAESLDKIEEDFENVGLAWKRAIDQQDISVVNRMLEAMNFFCDMRARYYEGIAYFTEAAAVFAEIESKDAHLTAIRLRARYARMILFGAGLPKAELVDLIEELRVNLVAAREYESPEDIAFLTHLLGVGESLTFNMERCLEYFEESHDIYSELNKQFFVAEQLIWIGMFQENFQETRVRYEKALAIQRDIQDMNGLGWSLMHNGRTAMWAHDFPKAEEYFEESVVIQRKRRDLKGLHSSLVIGSQRRLRLGDFDTALKMAEEASQIAGQIGLLPIRQSAMATLGILRILTEIDVEGGRRLCEEALEIHVPKTFTVGDLHLDATNGLFVAAYIMGNLEEMQRQYRNFIELLPYYSNLPSEKMGLLSPLGIMLLARTGQDEEAIELLSFIFNLPDSPESPMMTWMDRLPTVARLRTEVQERLGSAAYEAAYERGKSLDLNRTLQKLLTLLDAPIDSEPLAIEAASLDALTERELEILGLVADGLSNREIASQLFLALGTVKWYISEVYSKLGVTSRTQAVARARDLRLIA
jgi:predicted ATPase/DNA-binding CsgD family transcriptional regulator